MAMALAEPYPVCQARTNIMRDDETDLIAKARQGDQNAYREFVERYSDRVFSVAYQMVGNTQDAQDIAQEVFVRLHQSLGKYRATSRFTTWLYRMTVNLSIDYQRQHARHRNPSIDDSSSAQAVADPHPLPDKVAEQSELRGALQIVAGELTARQRSVFVLRDLQGFSTGEIATILKCRKSTVRVHLATARTRLKEALLRHYPDLCGGFQR